MKGEKLLQFLKRHPDWENVFFILEALQKKGFEALLAGGCVRDALLEKLPGDFDIATSAKPEDVKNTFPKTEDHAEKYGSIGVLQKGTYVEVTTFRQDGSYKDGRHPESVRFSSRKEDASRRDFTVNAFYLDPFQKKVLDDFEGLKDLKEGVIRCVGDPKIRFEEDHLRLLRAVRFAIQLDFSLEEKTSEAVKNQASSIAKIPKERIYKEISKMFSFKKNRSAINLLKEQGLFSFVCPYWEGWGLTSVENKEISFSAFFAFTFLKEKGQVDLKTYVSKLKESSFPGAKTKKIKALCDTLPQMLESKNKGERLLFLKTHPELMELLYFFISFEKEPWKGIRERFKEGLEEPWLKGEDFLEQGFKEGPKLGQILKKSYQKQLEGEFENKKELKKWALSKK